MAACSMGPVASRRGMSGNRYKVSCRSASVLLCRNRMFRQVGDGQVRFPDRDLRPRRNRTSVYDRVRIRRSRFETFPEGGFPVFMYRCRGEECADCKVCSSELESRQGFEERPIRISGRGLWKMVLGIEIRRSNAGRSRYGIVFSMRRCAEVPRRFRVAGLDLDAEPRFGNITTCKSIYKTLFLNFE